MPRFRVLRNQQLVCVAGIKARHVLSVHITSVDVLDPGPKVRRTLELRAGGLNSDTGQHLNFANVDLTVGDSIEVKVLDDGTSDEPKMVETMKSTEENARGSLEGFRERRVKLLEELRFTDENIKGYEEMLGLSEGKNGTETATKLDPSKRQAERKTSSKKTATKKVPAESRSPRRSD